MENFATRKAHLDALLLVLQERHTVGQWLVLWEWVLGFPQPLTAALQLVPPTVYSTHHVRQLITVATQGQSLQWKLPLWGSYNTVTTAPPYGENRYFKGIAIDQFRSIHVYLLYTRIECTIDIYIYNVAGFGKGHQIRITCKTPILPKVNHQGIYYRPPALHWLQANALRTLYMPPTTKTRWPITPKGEKCCVGGHKMSPPKGEKIAYTLYV